jgi:hypothetical protein
MTLWWSARQPYFLKGRIHALWAVPLAEFEWGHFGVYRIIVRKLNRCEVFYPVILLMIDHQSQHSFDNAILFPTTRPLEDDRRWTGLTSFQNDGKAYPEGGSEFDVSIGHDDAKYVV